MYLLDTCAISEEVKDPANPGFDAWIKTIPSEALYLSAVTLTEIVFGIERMPAGRRRKKYELWFEKHLVPVMAGRILPIDDPIAVRCGVLLAVYHGELADAMIAATALVHNLTLVTRNLRDFPFSGLAVFNPWSK